MAEDITVVYTSWKERQELVKTYEAQNLKMAVDEVRDGEKTMVFTSPPERVAAQPSRLDDLDEKLIEGTITQEELKEVVRRIRGVEDRYQRRQAELA